MEWFYFSALAAFFAALAFFFSLVESLGLFDFSFLTCPLAISLPPFSTTLRFGHTADDRRKALLYTLER